MPARTPDKMDTSPQRISAMFDGIAPSYDTLNHLLSLGVDRWWRRQAVRALRKTGPKRILDVATGTGDMAVALARGIGGAQVTGIDISPGMVEVARRKIARKGLGGRIELIVGGVSGKIAPGFDASAIAFGVRNFHNPAAELAAIRRVLTPGGTIAVLEFSMPRNPVIKALYRLYFHRLLPWIGGLVSGDKEAYTYLPDSVEAFPHGRAFLDLMARAGFTECREKRMTFGIATLYTGKNHA